MSKLSDEHIHELALHEFMKYNSQQTSTDDLLNLVYKSQFITGFAKGYIAAQIIHDAILRIESN